ncbi:transmembrane emp24 domain-containing protein, putative [Plasmodium relictum]|uniref:Transmembrane emp24 domain-containing protein, putative n=1 Tax=Plasmodium relictum TaxID=85471 RepID=A0A1J1H380_PLARL|nr:transmembrane emp24 domain-containing protein, putative [Plasmodium relictum]CRG99007.1 transmembrane emp24 domain-containing protein, putative [Plasmodium relictum]
MKFILTYYFIFSLFIILCVVDKAISKGLSDNSQNKENQNDNKNNLNSINDLNKYDTSTNENKSNKKNKKKKGTRKNLEDNLSGFINETKDNLDEDNFNEEYLKLEKKFQDSIEESKNERKFPSSDNNLNEKNNKMKPDIEDFHYYNDIEEEMESEDDLTNIWNKNMQNFEPSTLLTFEIAGNSEEYLFEEVNKIDTYFRGVFYSNNESDDNIIELLISDPDGNIVYKKEASEGIFFFYTKKIGVYTLTLKNNKWIGKKLTTVAIGLGENPSLSSDYVKDFTNYIQEIVHETKKLKNEIKYLSSKHMIHIEKMKKITNKAFIYCFIKLFVLIFLSLFTIYYIKNLVSNKRVL